MKTHFNSKEEWTAEGNRLFGANQMQWKFICPSCGHVATMQDWKDAGASIRQAAFSCVGRALGSTRDAFADGDGPCNYAGGGLFGLNPVSIEGRTEKVFAFARREGKG